MRRDARDDGHRGHQDVGAAASEDPERAGFPGRPAQHRLHGSLHAEAEDSRRAWRRTRLRPSPESVPVASRHCRRRCRGARRLGAARSRARLSRRRRAALQLRAKQLPSGAVPGTLRRRSCAWRRPYGASVIVNDRADLAVLAGAAGVHVGQDDLAPADARRFSVPTRSSASRRTQSSRSRRRCASRSATSRSGRCSAHTTKDTGYSAVGSISSRLPRGWRRRFRSSPSAASRSRQRASVIEAGATSRGGHRRSAGAAGDIRRDGWQRIFSVSRNIAYSPEGNAR